mmetsp:Transcript_23788/g.26705  ORF Transcript_23788/g.26705 Transcript_23788/m.26705 type:complete len:427 (-) Transcript_23788:1638-2918(-)
MPTRIVSKNKSVVAYSPKKNVTRSTNNQNRNLTLSTDIESVLAVGDDKTGEGRKNKRKSSRKIVRLRSSIIRGKRVDNSRALSNEDIRASPRLLGYCFQLLASIVMLINVSAFYRDEANPTNASPKIRSQFNKTRTEGNDFFLSPEGDTVRTWKLIGSFVISVVGTIVTLGIIFVHFDTIFCPSFWLRNFRDGSKYEQYLLIFLTIFWMIGLHVNTSFHSVGESQPNVFFTSWICFFSAVLNYGIWRISSGRRSIAEMVNDHHRETTYNWLWVLFCALIVAGAVCDYYSNRNNINGEEMTMSEWIIMMSISWVLVLVPFVSIILNHFLRKSCELRVFGGKGSFVLLGWRQAEGLVALIITVAMFYIVFQYTGGNNFFTGLNNIYFGVWGAFINSVILLATWLRENKNKEYIKNEEKNRENQIDMTR